MKTIRLAFTIIAIAPVLGGCAAMSEQECVTGDWHAIGFEDGANGRTLQQLTRYRESCAEYGITTDANAYRAGRDEGLHAYCTADRGYRVGLSGQKYNGVCPAELEPDFAGAHGIGYHLYTLRARVSNVENELHAKEEDLDDTEDKIDDLESRLLGDDITREERSVLLDELKEFSEDKGEIELQIKRLIDKRARHQYDVRLYEQEVAEYGYTY